MGHDASCYLIYLQVLRVVAMLSPSWRKVAMALASPIPAAMYECCVLSGPQSRQPCKYHECHCRRSDFNRRHAVCKPVGCSLSLSGKVGGAKGPPSSRRTEAVARLYAVVCSLGSLVRAVCMPEMLPAILKWGPSMGISNFEQRCHVW